MYLYLKQKVFTIGDRLTFYNENQQPVYFVKGSILKIPHRLTISDAAGGELVQVKKKIFALVRTYKIIDMRSNMTVGNVSRKWFSLTKSFNIKINGYPLQIKGSLFGFQFEVQNMNRQTLVAVRKKLISWGDAYEVSIDEANIPPEIACAICIAFDNAIHSNRRSR